MKIIPAATILSTLFLGVIIGAFLARPPVVKATAIMHVDKVIEGSNAIAGTTYIGFACTQTDCYIASH